MSKPMTLQQVETELMKTRVEGGMEQTILTHWRKYQPKLVQALLDKQMLMTNLKSMADRLLDLQIVLERTERLNPVEAKLEAWRQLMAATDDAAEEAEAFGMTVGDYLARA